jgi:hypothetical protein
MRCELALALPPIKLEVKSMRVSRTLFGLAVALALVPTAGYAELQHQPHSAKSAPTAKPTTGSPSNTAANPIATRISSHPQLLANIKGLLPGGMTLEQASAGFKNEGQFIAALHVSRNLDIPFAQLQSEMTGKDHDSLGKAIHDLKPGVDAKAAAKTAEQEADTDLKVAGKAGKDKDDK